MFFFDNPPPWLDEVPTYVPPPNETFTGPVWESLDAIYGTVPLTEFIVFFYEIVPGIPL